MVARTMLNGSTIVYIFRDSVFMAGEDVSTSIIIHGPLNKAARFNRVRLERHRHEIHELVDQLPDEFRLPEGASFAEANKNRRGHTWNGSSLPFVQEQLIQLGIAIGEIEYVDDSPDTVPHIRIKERA